jgi:hypothetical protein
MDSDPTTPATIPGCSLSQKKLQKQHGETMKFFEEDRGS